MTLLLVSLFIFFITSLLPGDAAQQALGQFATAEQVDALRLEMGLDQPALQRYLGWLYGMLQGDLGQSLSNQLPVTALIGDRLWNSLTLAAVTAAISVPLALALGILSAMYRGRLLDRTLNLATLAIAAAPEFLVATLGVLVFAIYLQWLPALTFSPVTDGPLAFMRAYALPVGTLCCVIVALMSRMTRAALIDQLETPYAEMALLKGATRARVVFAHALPNAVSPIANAVALSLSYLLGGVVIVETIFSYPGVAHLMVDGVTNRDLPLIQACAILFCLVYLVLFAIADVVSILSNPRLRN
jgi:peptide/nickel transport system permease protein